MSSANPVETKVETVAKVVDAAAALAGPTPPVADAAKAGWWALRNPKRFGIIAGSTALALAAGSFGWKYFSAKPPIALAQVDAPALTEFKPEEPAKITPTPAKRQDPDIVEPELPLVAPPKPGRVEIDPQPIKVPSPVSSPESGRVEIELPIKAPTSVPRPTETEPSLLLPLPPTPAPEVKASDIKKPVVEPDLFKAPPDSLPSMITDRKDKPVEKENIPVIRIGASADVTPPPPPKPSAVDVPPAPLIIDVPMITAPPTPKAKDTPPVPKINDLPPPPLPMIPKNDDLPPIVTAPVIGPAPEIKTPPAPAPTKDKLPDPPPLIKIDEPPLPPPTIKSPMIPLPEVKPSGVAAPEPGDPLYPKINVTPPPVSVKPEKKDMYDEDWHAQRQGDTYAIISKEYYKTADYSAALEAYNKERKKSGERIVRVPPPWVLEEQFPNLVGTKPDKSGVLEATPTGNPKFEPVAPRPNGERPAPLPSPASSSEEYRVKAEAGETIREIARKVYGDPNAWKKLYDLNPTLDPTQPIPSGTTLRLGK